MIDNYCFIDYVIYVEHKTIWKVNISSSKSIINILNKIGSEISVTFIDWYITSIRMASKIPIYLVC